MVEIVSSKLCELCNEQAALFCPSDSAFLCFQCDAKVHQANFLVARHLRVTLCSHCNSITKNRFSLCSPPLNNALCPSCSRNSSADSDLCSLSSSSSSTCVSSTQSSATTQKINKSSSNRKQFQEYSTNDSTGEVNSANTTRSVKLRDPRTATCVFMYWCRKLGMDGEEGVVQTACSALGICLGRSRALSVRVGLAACFWFCLKSMDDKSKSTWQFLKKLEEISGVPAKLILATELKLRNIVKANNRRRQGMEESWAESSP